MYNSMKSIKQKVIINYYGNVNNIFFIYEILIFINGIIVDI